MSNGLMADTAQRGFRFPSPEVFRPRREGIFHPSAFGFSRLAVQLISVSIVGLVVLLIATLIAADLRRSAADAALQSLLVKSDAAVVALSFGIDPEDGAPVLMVVPREVADTNGQTAAENQRPPQLETAIKRQRVLGLLSRILEGSPARARVFGVTGERLTDSSIVLEEDAGDQPETPMPASTSLVESIWEVVARLFLVPDHEPEPDEAAPDTAYPEVNAALGGVKSAVERVDEDGNVLISVANPIRNQLGQVVAVLHLRTAPEAVNEVAREDELAIVRVFLVAGLVAVFLSLLLAASITQPIRRLARAADRIRSGGVSTPMPELRDGGEVGQLSRTLHDMTAALYTRIDSIEAFAGEVAHELKNPLTSLRSAVETLPLARTTTARDQLIDVIQHDVRRIDRLISDISDASKLDAELNRHRYARVDLISLLKPIVDAQAELGSDRHQTIELVIRGTGSSLDFQVTGNDSRLSQVFVNLIDNARSFTPDDGRVTVTAQRFTNFVEIVVEDEGQGVAEEALEKIFERFYTDRSGQSSFGNNSGLGLAISRQIVEAHGGEIFAENRYRTTLGPSHDIAGARFTVRLPAGQ
ncbi:MAG: HAMP domain-containing sensor histidine kinase [Pseudomonadota bacterium]